MLLSCVIRLYGGGGGCCELWRPLYYSAKLGASSVLQETQIEEENLDDLRTGPRKGRATFVRAAWIKDPRIWDSNLGSLHLTQPCPKRFGFRP